MKKDQKDVSIVRRTIDRALGQRRDQVESSLIAELARIRRYRNAEWQDMAAATMLVSHVGDMMLAELSAGRAAGRGGWWDPERVTEAALLDALKRHLAADERMRMVVYAVMLWVREVDRTRNGARPPELKPRPAGDVEQAATDGGEGGGT